MEPTTVFPWSPYAEFTAEPVVAFSAPVTGPVTGPATAAMPPMTDVMMGAKPQYYYVEVGARLDQRWLEYLPVVDNRECSPAGGAAGGAAGTAMVLYVVDQAELMGIINSLHGLGLALVLVKRLADYRPEALS